MPRRTIASGSPFEPIIGFSRAVVHGHHVAVSGTAPIMPDGAEPPLGAYGQAKRVVVTGFVDPRWVVEMEADAILPADRS